MFNYFISKKILNKCDYLFIEIIMSTNYYNFIKMVIKFFTIY